MEVMQEAAEEKEAELEMLRQKHSSLLNRIPLAFVEDSNAVFSNLPSEEDVKTLQQEVDDLKISLRLERVEKEAIQARLTTTEDVNSQLDATRKNLEEKSKDLEVTTRELEALR